MTWQVFLNGTSLLLVSRDTASEAIRQAQVAMGSIEGTWSALPWMTDELDREVEP